LLLLLASKLFKNSITFDTVVYKNVPLLFFKQLHKTLADFNNFRHATLRRDLMQVSAVLAISP